MLKKDRRSAPQKSLTGNPAGPPVVKSISRASCILSGMGAGQGTITELATSCNLSKSTVHRILKALEETLLVSQNPITHRYYLGPLITRFSSTPRNTHEFLVTSAAEEMKRMNRFSMETVTLGVSIGTQYVHRHQIQSPYDLRVTEEPGGHRPLLLGATAKVLLSQLPESEQRIALKYLDLTPVTPNSVTDKVVLKQELDTIKQEGYSVSYGETMPGAVCITAPIKSYVLPAAMSVVGPESRLKPREKEVIRELKISVDRISDTVSGVFDTP